MHLRISLLSLIYLTVSGTAHAVSVTNRDDKDHKLTIVEGDTKQEKVLKPAEAIADICPKGCVIRLGDSENDEYELEGTEVVSIEDGYLYYDGSDVGSETAPGSSTQPPPSSKPTPAPPSK